MKKQSEVPTLLGALKYLWTWFNYRLNKFLRWAPDSLIGLLSIVGAILVLWTGGWGVEHLVADRPIIEAPWSAAHEAGTWGLGKARQAVCWPIKKVLSCCVPGLQGDQQLTKLWVLDGPDDQDDVYAGKSKLRFLVVDKNQSPETDQVTIDQSMLYSEDADCGHRWYYRDMQDPTMVMRHTPQTFRLMFPSGMGVAYVTEATYKKVEVGDVVALFGHIETGAPVDRATDWKKVAFVNEGSTLGVSKAFDTMMNTLVRVNQETAAYCKEERREHELRLGWDN